MPSFEDLERLFDKFPVWKCPECGERRREQFMLTFNVPFEVDVQEIDQIEKTLYARWGDGESSRDSYSHLAVYCRTCNKINPLPEGWKLVMR